VYIYLYIYIYIYIYFPRIRCTRRFWDIHVYVCTYTLSMEEIRLQIFVSPDRRGFPLDEGEPSLLHENFFEILWSLVKTCLKFTGTSMKSCWYFDSRNYFESDLFRPWTHIDIYPTNQVYTANFGDICVYIYIYIYIHKYMYNIYIYIYT